MNPMLSALKNRRSGQPEEQQTGGGSTDAKSLHDFVKQLGPEDKEVLQALLSKDSANAEQIAKGAPSKQEQMKIAEQSQAEQAEESMEETAGAESDVDSDEIAMGMLDTRFKNAAPSRPRNLHERVQTNMAKDLKAKGKI